MTDALFTDGPGGYRYTDPFTSHLAAVSQIGRKRTSQLRVLAALYEAGDDGLNDFELSVVVGAQQTSCGVRRGELRDAGLVVKVAREDGSTLTRPSPSGSPSICWRLSAAGVVEYESRPS